MMLRNLYINTKLYGPESKEVLMTRARLTQARHPDADYVPGITYKIKVGELCPPLKKMRVPPSAFYGD